MFRLPPTSTLFPCTTLFRSLLRARRARAAAVDPVQVEPQRLDHVGRDLADDEVDEVVALDGERRSEEHTLNSSHANISYAVFCLKKKRLSPPPPRTLSPSHL